MIIFILYLIDNYKKNNFSFTNINGGLMFKKISYLLDYFKYIENPFDALKFKFGLLKNCNLKIKNSKNPIFLSKVSSINYLMNFIPVVSTENLDDFLKYIEDIDNDNKYIVIKGIKFINVFNSKFIEDKKLNYNTHLEEFFTDDEWNKINFSKRHVIDIGGNIGDTALYFAKKGAEVISFEPVKHLHDLAIENVEINEDCSDRITLVNKGVGGKRGTISFQSNSVNGYADENSYDMEIISIQDLLNDYDFTPDILKMDCEGCEFEVILNNDLSMFNEIIFEHHSKLAGKDFMPLIEKLNDEGFEIKTYPIVASKLTFEDIGIIHAFK